MGEQIEKNKKTKKPIQILRERHGEISNDLKDFTCRQVKIFKKLSTDIKNNYKTVPEISQSTGILSHEIMWHLMAMKKYGKIIEGEERDGYCEYTLKEKETKT